MKKYGADLIVDTLSAYDVKYIFGIPGAKIDRVFDLLEDKGPKLIVAHHEQNAAFMAAAIGRLTGKPGVVLTTSGPGASNLVTGLITATSEGDPVLAISGQVKRSDLGKSTHQSMDNLALFKPITKFSVEIQDPSNLSEMIVNGYRQALLGKPGATYLSIPQDIVDSKTDAEIIVNKIEPEYGGAQNTEIEKLVKKIKKAQLPVFLVGMRASAPKETHITREIVKNTAIPVVETFQGAGIISRELENSFFGRVGLFRNQPGDILLKESDLVVTIGYDPVEYEARNWNIENKREVITIDTMLAEFDSSYQPELELLGDISRTLEKLNIQLEDYQINNQAQKFLNKLQKKREILHKGNFKEIDNKIHPLSFIHILQEIVDDTMTITVDVGSHYIWMARYFKSYEPRHLLFSNGMQTLGVALPWAISSALERPNTQVISISGDGGFLFSSQELATAVKLNLNIIHIIWNDGKYNMVEFQEEMKYGRSSGVELGKVDFVKYAEAFGAKGIRIDKIAELEMKLKEAINYKGVVVIDISIDYKDNIELGKLVLPDMLN